MEEHKDQYDRLMDRFQGDITGLFQWITEKYKKEKLFVADMGKGLEKRKKWLSDTFDFIQYLMEMSEQKEVETITWKVSYRKSKRLEYIDESKISEDYKTYEEIVKVDKKKITDDIKAWIKIDWAVLKEYENLQIK